MRSFVALTAWCLLVGYLNASINVLPPNKSLLYSYKVLINTGIPAAEPQYAAVAFKIKVQIDTISRSTAIIKFDEVQVAKLNGEIRKLEVESSKWDFKANSEYTEKLGVPFQVQFTEGRIDAIEFANEDTEWSREFKRGFAETIQVQLQSSRAVADKLNLVREAPKLSRFYKVMEPSLSGVCETQYVLQHFRHPSMPNSRVLNITKIRDYRKCEDKVFFVHSNYPVYKCSDCEADVSHPISKNTIVSMNLKMEGDSYLLEEVESIGIIKIAPLGEAADYYQATTNKTIKLLEVRPLSRSREIRTDRKETLVSTLTKKIEEAMLDTRSKDPILFPYTPKINAVEKVRALINDVAETITSDPSKKNWRSSLSNIVLIVKALRVCSYDELETLMSSFYSHHDETSVKKSIFLDVLAQSGTYPALLLWKKYTIKGDMLPERSVQFISTFTTHAIFPRPQILELILETVQSPTVRQHEQIFTTSVMSLGTLISRTCLRYKPYWHTPVEPEHLCPDPTVFIRPLGKLLDEINEPAKEIALVHALGETRIPEATKYLVKYATGEETDCELLQAEAVFAIGKIAKLYPEVARPILYAVYYNLKADSKVRIAALIGLFKTELNRHQLEKIAMFSWEETDNVVGSFLVEALDEISNSSHSCFSELSSHASHALNLINDEFDDGDNVVSANIYENEIEDLDITTLLTTLLISDDYPFVPQMFRANLKPDIASFVPDIFKVSFLGSGIKSAVDQLLGPVSVFNQKSFTDILQSIDEPNHSVGLRDIAEKLSLKPREDDETKAVLKLTLFNGQHRLFYLNREKLVKMVSTYGADMYRNLARGLDFHIQKTIMPLDLTVIIPTQAGLPLYFCASAPVHMSAKGKIHIELEGSGSSLRGLKVDLDVKPIFAMKMIPAFGVKLPAEQVIIGATYNTMVLFKPTISGELNIRTNGNNQVQLIVRPKMDHVKDDTILYYSTHPMTFIYKYTSLKPLYETAVPITYLDKPKEYEYPLGYGRSSAPLVVKVKHDTFWNSRGSIWDWADRYMDISAIPFWWVTQSWKNRMYEVVYTDAVSRSNEVELMVDWEYRPSESEPKHKVISGIRGLLTYLMGWSELPTKCGRESESYSRPWEVKYRKQKSVYESSHNRFDTSDNSEEVDDVWRSRRQPKHVYDSSEESEEQTYNSQWDRKHMNKMEYSSKKYESMYRDDHRHTDERRYSDEHRYNEGDADIEVVDSHKGVSKLSVNAKLAVRGTDKAIEAKLVLQKHLDVQMRTVDLVINTPSREIKQVCLKGRVQFPRMPCYYGGELPLLLNKEIRSEALIQWGHDCNSPLGFIDLKVVANKSIEQLKYDPMSPSIDMKPWFCAQCEKDRAKGIPYSDACIDTLNFRAQLNRVSALIKYDGIPPAVKNVSHHLALAFATNFYQYMSYKPVEVHNPEKTLRIHAMYHYSMPALDLKFYAPTYQAFFYKLPYSDYSDILEPPNVRKTFFRKVADSITDDAALGTAYVSGDNINTFDNQTYSYAEWGRCKHVLVMDCSHSNMFAVLTRSVGRNNKTLTVRILKHKIEINPTSSGSDEVVINGQSQHLSEDKRVFIYDKEFNKVVAYVDKHHYRYIVTLPQVGLFVRFDGYTIFVKMSQIWKNKVCGVFGDYDGDFDYEFRGPKQCAFENGDDMAKSYAIPDSSCSPPSVTHHKLCETEEERNPRTVHSLSPDSCYMDKTLKTRHQGKICFSKRPVTRCSPRCSEHGETTETVHYTCMDEDDDKAQRIQTDIDRHRPIYGLESKQTHYTKTETVPEKCRV